ncbi:MAG: ATP-binding protein, partial [Candidatus Methanomethyliaceae archaeon]|nr:ATP-binding protein [Candidatus Methanomethyliaceae archaeon]
MKNILYILNEKLQNNSLDPNSKSQFLEKFKVMNNQIWYMNKIIMDLQDLSRDRLLAPTLINPKNLFEEIIEYQNVPPNIKVLVDVDQKISVYLDDYVVRRVCNKLILNAIQAMPNGGTLTIKGKIEGKNFVIQISDTGVGIPKEDVSKLFTPFFTKKAKGMGLG